MMAGRNISASHIAFTSTRVMATCAVIGQAVGTAAAICVQDGLTPRQIWQRKDVLAKLQQRLLRDDQTIRGLRNQDVSDLARKAKVVASAEQPDAPAAVVINGMPRDIPKKEINQWMARMGPEGAWLELSWDKPQRLRTVQITFDSGFQRELTLTSSLGVNRGIVRAPQPETAKNYSLWYRKTAGAELVRLADVKENHQRLNRHAFNAVEAQAVRIHITCD